MLRLLLVMALSQGLVCPLVTRAESGGPPAATAAEPAGYKDLIESALLEFDHANFVEAREQFSRAHALYPNARTLRGLGMVEFELRNYVDALNYLEQALASQVKALSGPLRAQTEQLLVRVHAYVGTLELQVRPTTAQVNLDGFPIELGEGPLRLGVGDHVLEFHAEGHLSERRAFKLRGGQALRLTVQLTAPTQLTPGAHAADSGPPKATPVYKTWWLWTTVGLVAAGGAIAAVLLTRDKQTEEVPVLTGNTPPNATIEPLRGRW